MKLTNTFGKIHKTYALVGGCAGVAVGVFATAAAGSPLPVLRLLGAEALLPPVWLLGLLWLAGFGLLGAAAGYALACQTGDPAREAPLWRGMTFLVVEVTFSLAWYSLLFGSFLQLPGWLCLTCGVAAGCMCVVSWFQSCRLSAWAAGGVTAWLLYLVLCQITVILHN